MGFAHGCRSCVNKRRRVRTNCHAARSAGIASAPALEQELRELGDDHPDRAEAINKELTALRERAQRWYSDGGRVAPQPDNVPQGHAAESSATSRKIEEFAVRCERCDRRWRRFAPKCEVA